MIATILPSSTTFHAVDYNERKVSEGVAELLEMENFGFIGRVDSYTPEQLKQYLTKYTYRHNQRIQSPQFHLAISCRGDDFLSKLNEHKMGCVVYNDHMNMKDTAKRRDWSACYRSFVSQICPPLRYYVKLEEI